MIWIVIVARAGRTGIHRPTWWGYRMHTLTAIDADTGQSVALLSVLAPANHHDSQLLTLRVTLAQAIGVQITVLTADTADHDTDGSFFTTTGVHLITPPTETTTMPEHVDPETAQVFCQDWCEVPMRYVGYADHTHEYQCADAHGPVSACRHLSTGPPHSL